MAAVTGGTTVALNMDGLNAADLFDYDNATTATTAAKYFDDAQNYILFKGSGFAYDSNQVPTSGVVSTIALVEGGETTLKFLSLSNISATSIVAFASSGDTHGLLNLLLGGSDTITGTSLGDRLYGYGGNDNISGGIGNDRIDGGDGNDTIAGGDGNDVLIGGKGNDSLDGGSGKDTVYYGLETGTKGVIVNLWAGGSQGGLAADTATDTFGNTDIVANIPNVVGTKFSDRIFGGGHDNILNGGAGTDLIDGEKGKDTLTGGTGTDIFVFHTKLGGGNVDTITDFSATDDTIRLENAIFSALPTTGTLASGYFRANTTGLAQDSNDHIVYETDTGRLFYDADGTGAAAGVQFATLTGNPTLTAADFVVI